MFTTIWVLIKSTNNQNVHQLIDKMLYSHTMGRFLDIRGEVLTAMKIFTAKYRTLEREKTTDGLILFV